ncbi:SET domain-containing protein [Rhizopogon vinicolor AM-OR11-026]|uniref:SET domain-containing protein n=1 Tax=Rhizopogon vinicolor AM-OR11-026 TaxID=1314800 RepID=A0A1B7N245_9AGAM|nr:SET domain-containing protein [Rhizopogon vinicolor AM-OR11-026]
MDMWKRSSSPEETWSDAEGGNENGEWPIKGIVGEEINPDGTSVYEVRWGNWSRKDGTNTTWQTEIPDRADLVNRWKRHQRSKRNSMAQESLDIEVAWPDDDVHNRFTFLRAQAYEEKKLRRPGVPSAADWDKEIDLARRRTDEPDAEDGNAASRLRVRRGTSRSTISSDSPRPTSVKRTRRGTPFNTPPSSSGRDVTEGSKKLTTRISVKSEHASTSAWSSKSSSSDVKGDIMFVRPMEPLRGRVLLLSNWNRAAMEVGAAAIHISSAITDAEIGQHLEKFKYMEKKYYFGDPELQSIFEVDKGAFLACTCKRCDRPSHCQCQAESEVVNERLHNKAYAYNKGLFSFCASQGVEVIECNKSCACGPTCSNRVAQKPRDIPIEIFKTRRCGWGARSTVRLPRGKVLGIYTGRLLRREDVDNLPAEHIGYVFDLDGTEIRGQHNAGAKFSVDSYDYGNWTRFINHSCAPNMKVFSVVFDTIQEVNMPYVAFVAVRDIPAGEELTIDYDPSAAEEISAGTRKEKRKMSSTALLCKCGAGLCRGWIKQ